MPTLNKLLDIARETCTSDAEIARRLGLTRAAVSAWRNGGRITPAHLGKLIALTEQESSAYALVLAEQDAPESLRK